MAENQRWVWPEIKGGYGWKSEKGIAENQKWVWSEIRGGYGLKSEVGMA